MKTRQLATGTVLTASLLLGGGGLADAAGSRPAMDRGTVSCDDLLDRVEGLENAIAHMEARRARLEVRLADAREDGDARRVRRIEHQLAQVERVTARLQARVDRAHARYEELCQFQGT